MAESGVIEALLYLLSYHRCEENAARLLKFVLTNYKIRETNIAERAVLPLSDYLLDTQTQAQQARLLVTIALGDLFQNETLARSAHAGSACRALVNLLKDRPSEEMKLVAICALKNLVRYNGSNTTVVAEAGGVKIVLDLIASSDTHTSVHATMLIELVFSTDIIQAYASGETVRAITAAIEKNLCATGTVNDEYIKALNTLFQNFRGLTATKPATLSIPHLVTSLKNGSEATQEAALHALFLLSQAWSACPDDVSRPQSNAAADAIPLLQYLIQSGPPRFQEKAKLLLMCLPGTLTVVIKRGSNMNPPWGRYSYSCNLTLGKTPSRQTTACLDPDPQWYERFEWHFKTPPNGQKLRILCMMTGKMFWWGLHKATMQWGKVTIPIDRVVMLGVEAGEYNMGQQNKSASDTSKNLEVEIRWSKAP